MANAAQQQTNYQVEVSGWDSRESFFTEKTLLYWNSRGQEIPLRSRLREGAVLFVRLLQPFENEENFPVPYVVSKTLPVELDGRVPVSISRLHPRPSYRQAAEAPDISRINCA